MRREPYSRREFAERHAGRRVRTHFVKWLHTGDPDDARRVRRAARLDLILRRARRWTIPFRWRHVRTQLTPLSLRLTVMLAIIVTCITVIVWVGFPTPLEKPHGMIAMQKKRAASPVPVAVGPRPAPDALLLRSRVAPRSGPSATARPAPGNPEEKASAPAQELSRQLPVGGENPERRTVLGCAADPRCIGDGVASAVRHCVREPLDRLGSRIARLPATDELVGRTTTCLEKGIGISCPLSPADAVTLLHDLTSTGIVGKADPAAGSAVATSC